MSKIYVNPFDWDFDDDKSLIMIDSNMDKEEVQQAIEEALADFDIKLEGQDLLYKLIVNGQENGTINIPKDQFLKSVTYDSENKKFTFVVGDTTMEVNAADLFDGIATTQDIASIEEKNNEQDAALENLATKEEVNAVDAKFNDVYTKQEIDEAGFLKEHQDISNLATKEELEEVDAKIPSIDGLASETWVEEQGYLKEHQDISGKANVGDSYTKAESDERYALANELATVATSGDYSDLQNAPIIPSIEGLAVASDVTQEIAAAVAEKANVVDIPTKTSELENDSNFITSHQSLEDYATKTFVGEKISEIVGEAPETLDTLKEIADALQDNATMTMVSEAIATKANVSDVYTKGEIDNKIGDLGSVIEVEGQEPTYWQEGDELPEGVQVGDIKTEGVEQVSREKSVKEYVDESIQKVNEKPEVLSLQERLAAMENALRRIDSNAYQTMMNDLEVLDTLKETNTVTIEEGTIADIVVPETTRSKTITGELDPESTVTLTSRYGLTINNTSSEPTNIEATAPAVEGYNAATITLNSGEYDTVTLTDASLTVGTNASLQNVVITEETTKALTINAMFEDGATVTSNSDAPITVTNKNAEGEEVSITLTAPNSTVTLSGGKWETVNAAVSNDTLIIKKNAKVGDLTVSQGNVIVEVPRQSDIANVITGNIDVAEGYTITYRKYDIDNDNTATLGGVGECNLIENVTRTNALVSPLSPAWDNVWNLNNHTLTFENTKGRGAIMLRYGAKLEVNGAGEFVCADDYGVWVSGNDSKAIINGGKFTANTHVLYCEKGTIEVNGGEFHMANSDADKDENGNYRFLLNCLDANYKNGSAKIIVRGGKFYDFDPGNCAAEGAGTSFLADGYGSVMTTETIDGVEHKVYTVQAIN